MQSLRCELDTHSDIVVFIEHSLKISQDEASLPDT